MRRFALLFGFVSAIASGQGSTSLATCFAASCLPDPSAPGFSAAGVHAPAAGVSVPGDIIPIGNTPGANPLLGVGVDFLEYALDGTLFAAGDFTVPGTQSKAIAHWDGNEWMPLAEGLLLPPRAMAVAANGDVFVHGLLGIAGYPAEHQFGRWDGQEWSIPEGGPAGWAADLAAAPDGSIYAVGLFPSVTAGPNSAVLKWDGISWQNIRTGGGDVLHKVSVAPDGAVYVVGYYYSSVGLDVSFVSRWDGEVWEDVGDDFAPQHPVREIAIANDGNVYASVSIDFGQGSIVRLDGNSWHQLGSAFASPVDALAIDPDNNVIAGGYVALQDGEWFSTLVRWTGTEWVAIAGGVRSSISSISLDPNGSIAVGGAFKSVGNRPSHFAAVWNGSSWESRGASAERGVHALYRSSGMDVYARGEFVSVGGVVADGLAKWNGSSWSTVGAKTGLHVNRFSGGALAVADDGAVYVFNARSYSGGYFAGGDVVRWNGIKWTKLGDSFDWEVSKLALTGAGTLYAATKVVDLDWSVHFEIRMWNGLSWQPLNSNHAVITRILTVSPNGTLYGAGERYNVDDGSTTFVIAKWTGTDWEELGQGLLGTVNDVAFENDDSLFAVGDFTAVGHSGVRDIARWNGSTWTAIRDELAGWDRDLHSVLAHPDGSVYVSGVGRAGNSAGPLLARWREDSGWTVLLSGGNDPFDYAISELALDAHGHLVLGGSFRTLGGVYSPNLALFEIAPYVSNSDDIDERAGSLGVFPNPSNGSATARLSVSKPSEVVARVYDALGRVVRTLEIGRLPPGENQFDLDAGLAPGLYLLRVETDDEVKTVPFSVVR